MINNKSIIISIIAFFCSCTALFFVLKPDNKDAYVNIIELYENFSMKQDLEKRIQATQLERKRILDSLEVEFKLLSQQTQNGKYPVNELGRKRELFLLKERQFNEENEAQVNDYKQQIWKQLKQYTKDYAEVKGYRSIMGADEGFTVLYFAKQNDITNELKEYANQRYKGGKK